MKKTIIIFLTVILIAISACMAFAGCAAKTPPAPGGEPAQIANEKARPIYGNQIKDGTYAIEVSSSSSMFKIIDAQLTVEGGEMSAVLTLSGTGYEKLYLGTGEEASAAADDKCVYYVEDAEGNYTYKVPVTALNQDTDCAAWSIRKKMWYDRVLVFQSALIPEDAITAKKRD